MPDEYENLPCSLKRFNRRNIISALNRDMPDCNFIKGSKIRSNGAANIIRPAKAKIIAMKIEKIIIKILTFFEIFLGLAFLNQDKTSIIVTKITIPKKIKFIY